MSAFQSFSEHRHSRSRTSCDTCFLAKVKCSKERPICSRCLTRGADCKYSPSSQVSKSKSDERREIQSSTSRDISIPEISNTSTIAYTAQSMSIDSRHSASYKLDTDWSTAPNSTGGRMHRHSISSTTMPVLGDESPSEGESSGANTDVFDPSLSWTGMSGTDTTSAFTNNILLPWSKCLIDASVPPSLAPWFEGQTDHISFNSPPGLGPAATVYMSNALAKTPTCNCVNTCLQALQELHNSSSSTSVPPFDAVLTVNQKAVEGCAMMLNCPKCFAKSVSSTTIMLLGTIIGKIISFYQDAFKNYFRLTPGSGSPNQALPLTIGTYRVAGEDGRWLEMEIILRELRKLDELFAKFQGTARTSEWEGDAGMHSAITNYLGQSLHLTFEILNMQKSMTYE